jgi:uncharacterized protein YoxC
VKAKEITFLIFIVVLVCIVIKLSNKVQKMDQTISLLSVQMNATTAQINSAVQHNVPVIVGGFGADVS